MAQPEPVKAVSPPKEKAPRTPRQRLVVIGKAEDTLLYYARLYSGRHTSSVNSAEERESARRLLCAAAIEYARIIKLHVRDR